MTNNNNAISALTNFLNHPNIFVRCAVSYAINLLIFLATLNGTSGLLNNRLEWIQDQIIPIALLGSLAITVVSWIMGGINNINILKIDAGVVISVNFIIVLLFLLAPPNNLISKAELEARLADLGLTPFQTKEIEAMLDRNDYVTSAQLDHMGLTLEQRNQVMQVLTTFVRRDEVEDIIEDTIPRILPTYLPTSEEPQVTDILLPVPVRPRLRQ